MKTAAKILGITGGVIGLLVAFYILIIAVFSERFDTGLNETELILTSYLYIDTFKLCFFLALASILSITGGALVNKKKTASRVMLIISGVLSLYYLIDFSLLVLCGVFLEAYSVLELINILASILLLLGGIFALIPEKKTAQSAGL